MSGRTVIYMRRIDNSSRIEVYQDVHSELYSIDIQGLDTLQFEEEDDVCNIANSIVTALRSGIRIPD